MAMKATMRRDLQLLGTSLQLNKGDVVEIVPATNLPSGDGMYFASLPEWDHDGSMLVMADDIEVCDQ